MCKDCVIAEEVPGLYRVVSLNALRRTRQVSFDTVPTAIFSGATAMDRVLHEPGAVSPGPVGDVARPWYMHPCQDDNLIVLHGARHIDIFTPTHGKVESFVVTPNMIAKGEKTIYDGPAMLVWPRGVFHRIRSDDKEGSASLNFAVHHEGFDLRTNFNIYDLDTDGRGYKVIRAGHLDQQGVA